MYDGYEQNPEGSADGPAGGENRAGCACRNDLFSHAQLMPVGKPSGTQAAAEIQYRVTDVSQIPLQIISRQKQQHHIAEQMVKAEMEKHRRKEPVILPGPDQRRV